MKLFVFFLTICFSCTVHTQEFEFQNFLDLDFLYKNSKILHGDTSTQSVLGINLKKISFLNEDFHDFKLIRGVDSENTINIKAFTCSHDSFLFIYNKGQLNDKLKAKNQLIYLTVYDTIHEALLFLRIKDNNVISFTQFRKGVGDNWSSKLYIRLKNESKINKSEVNYFIKSIKDWGSISKLEPFDLFHSEVGPMVTTEYINFLVWTGKLPQKTKRLKIEFVNEEV